jgi:serine/threonine-protein kinase
MTVTVGSRFGDYQLQDVLGRGASSVVYRAIDSERRAVAVKVIREELLVDAERTRTIERFTREARIGKSLRHPNIIHLFDWGEHNGVPYMVMDLIAGERLDELIARAGVLPLDAACGTVIPVLDGLEYAHTRNVVHRDVKPANIVFREGRSHPILTDFGIAHIAGSALTQLGDLLGTPAYLSPEQLRGELPDQRSDVFAAGVMLYELTTGRRPFGGSIADVMRQILFDDPVPPSTLQPQLTALDAIVLRALAKEPSQRFVSAGAFAAALRQLPQRRSHTISVSSVAPAPPLSTQSDTALRSLENAFAAARRGIDRRLSVHIGDLLAHLPAQDVARAAELCGDRGLPTIAQQLYATAPLPGHPAADSLDIEGWLGTARLLRQLYEIARRSPRAAEAEAVLATLAHALACDILAFASDVGERLTADEAPDLEILAPQLTQVDQIAIALDAFYAPRERRLVQASLQLVTGQILRRAAIFIDRYARDRDPLTRFDVVNMLVQMEDLIAVTSRLLDDVPPDRPDAVNAVTTRNVAALSGFLQAVTHLVDVSEELLDAAMNGDADTGARDFVSHLRQLRLIYHFGIRLDGQAFRQPLASLSQRIYDLCVRLSRALTGAFEASESQRRCLSALHDLAEELGWRELAAQLLTHSRRSLLSAAAFRA